MHALSAERLLSSHGAPGAPIAPGGHAALSGHAALGGGGIGGLIVHLIIWRMIWRLGMLIWHIPTFGPGILLLIIIAVIALGMLRSRRGLRMPWDRGGSPYRVRDRNRDGTGPREW